MTLSITRAVLVMAALAAANAQTPPGVAIGALAPDFSLPGVDGKPHTLKEYSSAKVLAVFFTCNSCAAAQLSEDSIAALHREFRSKGVAVVAINPNYPRATRLDELSYTDGPIRSTT
jgi:thiol-disulfide isomerase/thioredoxin